MNIKYKYFKYKNKYINLKKNQLGGYDINNFGYIKLNEETKSEIFNDSRFNFNKQIQLVDLIKQLYENLIKETIDLEENDNLIDKIKNIYYEITNEERIKHIPKNIFIEKIFGDLTNKINRDKQYLFWIETLIYNIYGFSYIDYREDKIIYNDYSTLNMFINCVINKILVSDSYLFFYIDGNYKIVMIVNNGLYNNETNVSEHIFIHKLPSTIISEKLFDLSNIPMALHLHKYSIQILQPDYIMSNPIGVMKIIFKQMTETSILEKLDLEFTTASDSKGIFFCRIPDHVFKVLQKDNLIT
jgi:hypothetical protein